VGLALQEKCLAANSYLEQIHWPFALGEQKASHLAVDDPGLLQVADPHNLQR
jgi:hypothetical protein